MAESDIEMEEPNISDALKRKLRYKKLLDKTVQIENQLHQLTSQKSLKMVKSVVTDSNVILNEGKIDDRLEHTTEVVMDAQLLKMNFELVSKIMQQNTDFNEAQYLNKISSLIAKNSKGWDAIANIMCGIARTVNIKSTMLGAIEESLQERVVKQRQKRKTANRAEEVQPETINKIDTLEKFSYTHTQILQLFEENGNEPIPYFKLIVDPTNFMNSVENALQMSFLFRDNIVIIEKGPDNHPQIRLTTEHDKTKNPNRIQVICKLTMAICQKWTEFYNITEPLLKQSPSTADIDGNNEDTESDENDIESD